MRVGTCSLLLAAFLLGAQEAGAQQDTTSLIATYYRCNTGLQDQVDGIVAARIGPVFARHQSAGHISSWGWMSHAMGGGWRRVLYLMGPNRDTAWDWWSDIIVEIQSEEALAVSRLNDICNSHDDYIWKQLAVTEVGGDGSAAPATLSSYFSCDQAQEEKADAIVRDVIARVYDEHVDAGDFDGWSWWGHDVGGPYRRLLILNGPNHKSIMNGRDLANAAVRDADEDAMQKFLEICPSHEDYLWSRVLPDVGAGSQ